MELSKVLEKELLEGRFWTHSKTLVDGCTKVSPGCKNCWSEALAKRFGNHVGVYDNGWNGKIVEHWDKMLDILPKPGRTRKPRVWCYWNDVFHAGVSDNFLVRLFNLIEHSLDCNIICTKRPERAVEFLSGHPKDMKAKNAIIMVTMENQEMVQKRWKSAAQLAGMGFRVGLLIEPMLSPIEIDPSWLDLMTWVICGPENGQGKRPFDGQWAMRLQAQAEAAGVPFFYKAGLLNGKRRIETP